MPQRVEMTVGLFPQDVASPTQIAASVGGWKPVHDEPWHGDLPTMNASPPSLVLHSAFNVAVVIFPIVGTVIEKSVPEPCRIGEVDRCHAAGIERRLKNPVGGKRKCPVGETVETFRGGRETLPVGRK